VARLEEDAEAGMAVSLGEMGRQDDVAGDFEDDGFAHEAVEGNLIEGGTAWEEVVRGVEVGADVGGPAVETGNTVGRMGTDLAEWRKVDRGLAGVDEGSGTDGARDVDGVHDRRRSAVSRRYVPHLALTVRARRKRSAGGG
jgi:hypothetical protein